MQFVKMLLYLSEAILKESGSAWLKTILVLDRNSNFWFPVDWTFTNTWENEFNYMVLDFINFFPRQQILFIKFDGFQYLLIIIKRDSNWIYQMKIY